MSVVSYVHMVAGVCYSLVKQQILKILKMVTCLRVQNVKDILSNCVWRKISACCQVVAEYSYNSSLLPAASKIKMQLHAAGPET